MPLKVKVHFQKSVDKVTFIYAAALSGIRLNFNAERDGLHGAY